MGGAWRVELEICKLFLGRDRTFSPVKKDKREIKNEAEKPETWNLKPGTWNLEPILDKQRIHILLKHNYNEKHEWGLQKIFS